MANLGVGSASGDGHLSGGRTIPPQSLDQRALRLANPVSVSRNKGS